MAHAPKNPLKFIEPYAPNYDLDAFIKSNHSNIHD